MSFFKRPLSEARRHLTRLLEGVQHRAHFYVLTNHGREVAMLIPYDEAWARHEQERRLFHDDPTMVEAYPTPKEHSSKPERNAHVEAYFIALDRIHEDWRDGKLTLGEVEAMLRDNAERWLLNMRAKYGTPIEVPLVAEDPNAMLIGSNAPSPLPIKELFALPVGASFLVYYAKDDDPINALRLNYDRQYVGRIEDGTLTTTDPGYEWYLKETEDLDNNVLDTGRGLARFYKDMPWPGQKTSPTKNS